MRGHQERSGSLFSYVSIEERIPASHPLRRIRKLADQALDRLNPTFCDLYASEGRPSMPQGWSVCSAKIRLARRCRLLPPQRLQQVLDVVSQCRYARQGAEVHRCALSLWYVLRIL
jgi:hypothetical protein